MNIAIIDLGTNTFNLLVAKVDDAGSYEIIENIKTSVKLGEGCINHNYINEAAFKRGITTLKNYTHIISKHKVLKTYAYATSGIRSAMNGNDFVAASKEILHTDINVISGNKEAELIYRGVKLSLDIGSDSSLIMDIGGGSTEFIIADKNVIFWKKSFDLGAARLLERFKPTDPMKPEEINAIEDYLIYELSPLFEAIKKFPVKTLIGSSGSFDTMAEMIAHKFYNSDMIDHKTEYTFHLNDYFDIHQQLIKSTRQERFNTKGILEMRVDMIVIASVFVNFILNQFNINQMRLSTYALKEGVLGEIINGNL